MIICLNLAIYNTSTLFVCEIAIITVNIRETVEIFNIPEALESYVKTEKVCLFFVKYKWYIILVMSYATDAFNEK